MMKVTSSNKKLGKAASNAAFAQQVYGKDIARALATRVKQLKSATCIADLIAGPGLWRPKRHDLKDVYAPRVTPNYRLLVAFDETETIAELIDIVDYH